MDPLMRQWLSSLKKQTTELEWQNRGIKPLNETIYGIVSKVLLNEDNGMDPDLKRKILDKHEELGRELTPDEFENIMKSHEAEKKPVKPSIPNIKRVGPRDLSKWEGWEKMPSASLFAPEGETVKDEPLGLKMDKEWNEAIERLTKGGVQLPREELSDQLKNIHRKHGPEALLRAMRQMAGQEQAEGRAELGLEPEPKAKRSIPGAETSKSPTAAEAGVKLPKPIKPGEPITPPSTKTPEEASTKAAESLFGKLPVGKAKEAGTSTLFGVYGAASLPGDIQKIAKRLAEPSYGRSEVISSPDYKPEMTDAEIAFRGKVMGARDFARTGEHGAMAGGIASKVPGASKTLKAVQKGGELATKAFAPLAVMSSGLDAVSAAQRGEYGEATRRGAEGAAWGASMFPALSRFANIGLGKQFTRGAGAAFADPESGAFEKAAAGVGGALGAGMLGKEVLGVGKAFAKGGLKTGGKALAKSTGLGALVAAPFAISRAAEGDVAGAALEVAGAIPGAALVTEPILAYRDVQREQEKQKAQQEKQQQFMQQRYEKFMSTHKDLEKTEGKGVPEFMKYGEEELRAQEAAEKRKQKEQTTPKFVYENVIREGLKARGF